MEHTHLAYCQQRASHEEFPTCQLPRAAYIPCPPGGLSLFIPHISILSFSKGVASFHFRPGGAAFGSHGRKPMVGVSAHHVAPEGPSSEARLCRAASTSVARAAPFHSGHGRFVFRRNVGALDGPSGAEMK